MTDSTQRYNMIITRLFEAPIEQVWHAWSASEKVMGWWGPMGFTCPTADMDFREGNTSLVCMRTPNGHDLYNIWTYQTIIPLQKIEFIQGFSDADGNPLDPAAIGLPSDIPAEVLHLITFNAVGKHHTELTVTEYGYPNEEIVELSKAGMEQCLDKMAALFTHS
jgi:uncharacterized protein YndB with AHSA1/START domain